MNIIRKFTGGPMRDGNSEKFEYTKFINPLNDYSFAKYMHKHRKMPDGTLRAADDWQKGDGMPVEELMASLKRHVQDLELILAEYIVVEIRDSKGIAKRFVHYSYDRKNLPQEILDNEITIEDACNGIRFNSEAIKLHSLKSGGTVGLKNKINITCR